VGKEGESGVEGRVRGNGAYLVWREEQVLPVCRAVGPSKADMRGDWTKGSNVDKVRPRRCRRKFSDLSPSRVHAGQDSQSVTLVISGKNSWKNASAQAGMPHTHPALQVGDRI